MSAPQYRQDALYLLSSAESAVASARKQVESNPNPKSVRIAESTLPSLIRRVDELKALAASLPDRPARQWGDIRNASPFHYANAWPNVGDSLDIPAFLKR